MLAARSPDLTAQRSSQSATAASGSSSRTRSGAACQEPAVARRTLLRSRNVVAVAVTEDAVRADPDLIMDAATPWSEQLTRTVVEIIGSGQLRQRGARHSGRSPSAAAALRAAAVSSTADREGQEWMPPAPRRSVREALLALERTVWLRIEMRSAFSVSRSWSNVWRYRRGDVP